MHSSSDRNRKVEIAASSGSSQTNGQLRNQKDARPASNVLADSGYSSVTPAERHFNRRSHGDEGHGVATPRTAQPAHVVPVVSRKNRGSQDTARRHTEEAFTFGSAAVLRAIQSWISSSQPRRLIDNRDAILGTRVSLRQRRKYLQNKRKTLVDRDAQFFQQLRKLASQSSSSDLVDLLLQNQDLLNVREELHLEEYDYHDLEDDLNQAEWGLNEEEEGFYDELREIDYLISEGTKEKNNEGGELFESATNIISTRNSFDRESYVIVNGRNDIPHHDHENRVEQKSASEAGKNHHVIKQNFADEVKASSEHVATNAPVRERSASEDIDVSCSLSQFDAQAMTETPDDADMKVVSGRYSNLGTRDPLYIPGDGLTSDMNHDDSPSIMPDDFSEARQQATSTVFRVNDWILNILRRSQVEIRRFKTTEKLRSLPFDRSQLARMVLEWWPKDGAVKDFPPLDIGITSTAPSLQKAKSAELPPSDYIQQDERDFVFDGFQGLSIVPKRRRTITN